MSRPLSSRTPTSAYLPSTWIVARRLAVSALSLATFLGLGAAYFSH